MRTLHVVMAVCCAAVTFALLPGVAQAGVHCGDVINEDTVLHADLIDCPGDGLVIAGADVTLDLGGHTIDGQGVGTGILNFLGTRVQIRDGTIAEFATGIELGRVQEAAVVDNVIDGNSGAGLSASHSGSLLVEDNVVTRNGTGVALSLSGPVVALRNVISGNSGDGIFLSETTLDAQRNRITRNGGNGIDATIADLTASRNVISRNDLDGVLSDRAGARLTDNRIERNGDDGIDYDDGDGYVAGNRVWFNGDLGIEAVAGVTDGGANWAKHNGDRAQCVNVDCATKGKPKR